MPISRNMLLQLASRLTHFSMHTRNYELNGYGCLTKVATTYSYVPSLYQSNFSTKYRDILADGCLITKS